MAPVLRPSHGWTAPASFPCGCAGELTVWFGYLMDLFECEVCGAVFYPSGDGLRIQLAVLP